MLTPQQVLKAISNHAHTMVEQQYKLLNQELIPALEKEGVRFIRRTRLILWVAGLSMGMMWYASLCTRQP